MAENESLDLKSPYSQRWNAVRDAARTGASSPKVEMMTRKRLYDALRKVRKQFMNFGVTIADFFAGRSSHPTLRELLRKTKRHQYAELLVNVLKTNPTATEFDCLKEWVHAILDTVFEQISHGLVGSDLFPSVFEPRELFRRVRHGLEPDVERIALKFCQNSDWEPRQAPRKQALTEDATAEMLPMSLLAEGNR